MAKNNNNSNLLPPDQSLKLKHATSTSNDTSNELPDRVTSEDDYKGRSNANGDEEVDEKFSKEKEKDLSFLKKFVDELLLLLDKKDISTMEYFESHPQLFYSCVKKMQFSKIEYFRNQIREGKISNDQIAKELNTNYSQRTQTTPRNYDDILTTNAIKTAKGEHKDLDFLDVNTYYILYIFAIFAKSRCFYVIFNIFYIYI